MLSAGAQGGLAMYTQHCVSFLASQELISTSFAPCASSGDDMPPLKHPDIQPVAHSSCAGQAGEARRSRSLTTGSNSTAGCTLYCLTPTHHSSNKGSTGAWLHADKLGLWLAALLVTCSCVCDYMLAVLCMDAVLQRADTIKAPEAG